MKQKLATTEIVECSHFDPDMAPELSIGRDFTGKLSVEFEQINKGTLWLNIGTPERGQAHVMVELYNNELVVRTYVPHCDEPMQEGICLIQDVEKYNK